MGFFTDTTVCIGCKACEVACKQWNDLPADGSAFRKGGSYDHTGSLAAATWRHVRFVETARRRPTCAEHPAPRGPGRRRRPTSGCGDLSLVDAGRDRAVDGRLARARPWVFMSDVCKHCTNAGCLDACPTGALIRTEFETVVAPARRLQRLRLLHPVVPVRRRRPRPRRRPRRQVHALLRPPPGRARAGLREGVPDRLDPVRPLRRARRRRAQRRVARCTSAGVEGAYLYGAGDAPGEQLAGGLGAFFLLTEPPERYGLPAQADSPIQENGPGRRTVGRASARRRRGGRGGAAAALVVALAGGRW